ncbi:hypothetical protein, partial [Streptomyces nogalater]
MRARPAPHRTAAPPVRSIDQGETAVFSYGRPDACGHPDAPGRPSARGRRGAVVALLCAALTALAVPAERAAAPARTA